MILLTWILIDKILWIRIRIQSIRIHITGLINIFVQCPIIFLNKNNYAYGPIPNIFLPFLISMEIALYYIAVELFFLGFYSENALLVPSRPFINGEAFFKLHFLKN